MVSKGIMQFKSRVYYSTKRSCLNFIAKNYSPLHFRAQFTLLSCNTKIIHEVFKIFMKVLFVYYKGVLRSFYLCKAKALYLTSRK